MNYSGRDHDRESRRAGDDFVRGADGRILKDRYGRPIRKRPAGSRSGDQQRATPPRQTPPRQTPPRQTPPRQVPPAQPQQPQQQPPRQAPLPAYAQPHYQQQYRQEHRQDYPPQPEAPRRYRVPAPPEGHRPHRRRKRTSPVKGCLGCAGWVLAIVVVASLVLMLWADTRLTRVEAMPAQQVAKTAGTNWLLVGSDSRQGLTEEQQAELGTGGDVGVGRTDTIMLLHIPSSGKAQLISIPRDSYVSVPGFGQDKVNAAFTYGGPQLLTETVEGATGLHIDHYAEIGMGGLANVVDSVGGVDICVAEPINDPLANLDVQPGCQKLDGPTALGYVRTRATAMGDLDRVARQREFFAALLDKITSPATLINPFRAVSLINHTASSFIVGEDEHVWHLARVALAMGTGVETQTIPIGGFMDTEVGNVVLWDDAQAQQLFDSLR